MPLDAAGQLALPTQVVRLVRATMNLARVCPGKCLEKASLPPPKNECQRAAKEPPPKKLHLWVQQNKRVESIIIIAIFLILVDSYNC